MTTNELSHFGVPGMRWGYRRGELNTSGYRIRAYPKKTVTTKTGKKVRLMTDDAYKKYMEDEATWNSPKKSSRAKKLKNVKDQKLSYYERNKLQQERAKKAALAVTALYIFGRPLYKMAKGTARVAKDIGIPIGKQFVREGARAGRAAAAAKWANRGLHFSKGVPAGAEVIEGHFVNVGKQFLLGAGYRP